MNDFDFLAGEWTLHNRHLSRALEGRDEWETFPGRSTCTRFFDGAANIDLIHFPTLGRHGMSVRLYRPATDAWSIYWVSSRDGILQPPVTGGFADGIGTFLGDDTYEDRPIRVRYLWSEITDTSARWEQAFSIDGDRTWETNWIMAFQRDG